MKLLKRITTTLTASVDSAVRQIENHDALVEASIKNARHQVAESKVRLARARKEGERLTTECRKLREDEKCWAERAQTLASHETEMDEQTKQKALACLKRRNTCQQHIVNYRSLSEKQDKLEAQMAEQLGNMQLRLDEMKLAQNQMRARHSNAEVQRVVNQLEPGSVDSLDDIFDRWDVKLTEAEMGQGSVGESIAQMDTLENQFVAEEEQEALNAEFEAMIKVGGKDNG